MLDGVHYALGALSGSIVGLTLGLVGGGGSILAVPLLVYLVGVGDPHVAIGTSALGVAVNAATGLVSHARAGTVRWGCGLVFAATGVAGALLGSSAGKAFDGQRLLFLFALLMMVIALTMLRRSRRPSVEATPLSRETMPRLAALGLSTGVLAGFFGIGGGFLVVPGLIAATRMPIINAVGTSLVAVSALALTTAVNYAASGLIDWRLAAALIIGGIAGGLVGAAAARRLASRGSLRTVFGCLVLVVACYMGWRSADAYRAPGATPSPSRSPAITCP